ncbi:hypothetical protein [Streptomyces sp. NPDC092903]|uniref:hypothetical protein n=1 Tax=Streptomyces sp. NPDC092903 TaxID=3366017 RepID=UPI003827A4B8
MDLADYSSYTVTSAGGNMVKTMAAGTESVYFTDETGAHAYSMTTGEISRIDAEGLDLGEVWGGWITGTARWWSSPPTDSWPRST